MLDRAGGSRAAPAGRDQLDVEIPFGRYTV
jgi:hypothetical protein